MKRRAAWDIEVTFDPTYGPPHGGFYIARAYRHGSRTLAYMLDAGHSPDEAVGKIQQRISESAPKMPTPTLTTVMLDKTGAYV